jgi:hypothetical protein
MMTRQRSSSGRLCKRMRGLATLALLATEETTAGDGPTSNTMTGMGGRDLHYHHSLLGLPLLYRHRALITKTGEMAVGEEREERDTRRDMVCCDEGEGFAFRPWGGGIISTPPGNSPHPPFKDPRHHHLDNLDMQHGTSYSFKQGLEQRGVRDGPKRCRVQ